MENVAYFTPPAIGDYGKRRIFHALDNLNTIKDNKTAQQQRQPCRFRRAGSVFSAKQQVFIGNRNPKSLTSKHAYSMGNVAYSAYQR